MARYFNSNIRGLLLFIMEREGGGGEIVYVPPSPPPPPPPPNRVFEIVNMKGKNVFIKLSGTWEGSALVFYIL